MARRIAALVLTPAVGLGGAVVTDLVAGSTAAHADSYNPPADSYNTYISRSEVLARARNWYDRRYDSDMTYSPNGDLYTSDVDGGHDYRRDCSGYVAMAWHTSAQPDTYHLQTSPLTTPISRSELQPGDILVDDVGAEHHAVIFQGWNDNAKTSFQYYSFGGTPVMQYPDGDFNGNIASHSASHYTPYRYNNIVDSATGVSAMRDGTTDRVFFRGADGALWQYYLIDGHWTVQRIGGQIIGSPSALYDSGSALLRVFAQGADHALWQFYWDGSSWQEQRIGGTLTSGVGATMDGDVVRAFFRGGDGSLWQFYLSGGHWTSQEIGGYMLDNPAAENDGQYLRVFFQGTDGAMWQYYYDGSSWRSQRVGGEFVSGFGVYWVGGVSRVFGRGAGAGALYQYYLANGHWTLQSLGGQITSGAGAIYDGDYLRVFARGADGALWQDYWDGSAWHWQKIGGQVA
jgi:hypothetical protein